MFKPPVTGKKFEDRYMVKWYILKVWGKVFVLEADILNDNWRLKFL